METYHICRNFRSRNITVIAMTERSNFQRAKQDIMKTQVLAVPARNRELKHRIDVFLRWKN